MQRYGGVGQITDLTCECPEDYKVEHAERLKHREQEVAREKAAGGENVTAASPNRQARGAVDVARIESLEPDNPRADICGRHPDHIAQPNDIENLVRVFGNYLQAALAQIARTDLGSDILLLAYWFTHYDESQRAVADGLKKMFRQSRADQDALIQYITLSYKKKNELGQQPMMSLR